MNRVTRVIGSLHHVVAGFSRGYSDGHVRACKIELQEKDRLEVTLATRYESVGSRFGAARLYKEA